MQIEIKVALGAILCALAFSIAPLQAQEDSSPSFEDTGDNNELLDEASEEEVQPPAVDVVEEEQVVAEEPEQPEINPDASFTPTEEISEDKPVAFPVDI